MPAENQIPLKTEYTSKTTASEVMEGMELWGKTAVVTGGHSGIGLEVVKSLMAAGAEVIAPVRNKAAAQEAFACNGVAPVLIEIDLADLASVFECAAEIGDAFNAIDFLFNNAGVMACPESYVGAHWERQFAVNHIGHFVLSRELSPYLFNAGGARMVTTSSVAHKRSIIRWGDIHFEKEPYEKWVAYGQSKTACALFALEANSRWAAEGVTSFSVHPGPIVTPIMRHISKEELALMGWLAPNGELTEEAKGYVKTPEQGAASLLWAATSPLLNDRGGEYCEDCDIAGMSAPEEPRWRRVAEWAVDKTEAERLWALSESMVLSAQA